jgi:hypothetical protein
MLRIVGVVLYIFTFLLLVGCLDAPAIPEPSQEPLDKPYTEEKVANTPKVSPEDIPQKTTILDAYHQWNGQHIFFKNEVYRSGQTIYYDGETVEFEIRLPLLQGLSTTPHDLEKLKSNNILVINDIGNNDPLSLSVDERHPNIIHVKLTPITINSLSAFGVMKRGDGP